MRPAQPVALASRLFQLVAGRDGRSPARRSLGGAVVAVASATSALIVLAGSIAVLSAVGVIGERLAPAPETPRSPAISWFLIGVISVSFIAVAIAVSWTSRRRADRDEATAPPAGSPKGSRSAAISET